MFVVTEFVCFLFDLSYSIVWDVCYECMLNVNNECESHMFLLSVILHS